MAQSCIGELLCYGQLHVLSAPAIPAACILLHQAQPRQLKCSQAACNLRRGDQLTYKPQMNSHRTGGPVQSASELRAVTTLLLLSAVALGRA